MRIVLQELKKILNWKIGLLLVLANAILYFLLISYHIEHFPNGRPALDSYRIGIEMVEKYGVSMSEGEKADFKETYEQRLKDADEYIQSRVDFSSVGIHSYQDFQDINYENQEQAELRNKVVFEENVDLFWELQERERLIEFQNENDIIMANEMERGSSQQVATLEEIKATGNYYIYPELVFYNYKDFIVNVAIAIIVSVVLLLSPVFIRDRSLRLVDLQYTTRVGRNIFKRKMIAGLLAMFMVITALLAIYFSIYSLNNTGMFFSSPINSFIGGFHWYDITFFQYIVLTVLAIYFLGFVFALLAMIFSNLMPNFVALVGIQIPFIIAMIGPGISYLIYQITALDLSQWLVPSGYVLIIVIGSMFMLFVWRRERTLDIVH
ncbi:hypothetical protein [Ornithinibacillus californiensis]|uniref:hypothetical protein n=1 Tax=Ornithinibacillus californiensis TaxID=161536 RepID=UPI00064D7E92|nr:hypothetical protein [Ornithinibacillus californiensis]